MSRVGLLKRRMLARTPDLKLNLFAYLNGVAGTISKIAVFVDWVTLPQLMRGLHGSADPPNTHAEPCFRHGPFRSRLQA